MLYLNCPKRCIIICQIFFQLIDKFVDELLTRLPRVVDCPTRVLSTMEKYKHFTLAPSIETNYNIDLPHTKRIRTSTYIYILFGLFVNLISFLPMSL